VRSVPLAGGLPSVWGDIWRVLVLAHLPQKASSRLEINPSHESTRDPRGAPMHQEGASRSTSWAQRVPRGSPKVRSGHCVENAIPVRSRGIVPLFSGADMPPSPVARHADQRRPHLPGTAIESDGARAPIVSALTRHSADEDHMPCSRCQSFHESAMRRHCHVPAMQARHWK
jgi:hypothetical protein